MDTFDLVIIGSGAGLNLMKLIKAYSTLFVSLIEKQTTYI